MQSCLLLFNSCIVYDIYIIKYKFIISDNFGILEEVLINVINL